MEGNTFEETYTDPNVQESGPDETSSSRRNEDVYDTPSPTMQAMHKAEEEERASSHDSAEDVLDDFVDPTDFCEEDMGKDMYPYMTSWQIPAGFELGYDAGEGGKQQLIGLLENPDFVGGGGAYPYFLPLTSDHDFQLSEVIPTKHEGMSLLVRDYQTGKAYTVAYQGGKYVQMYGGKPVDGEEMILPKGTYHLSHIRSPEEDLPVAPVELIDQVKGEAVLDGFEGYDPALGHYLLYVDPVAQTMSHISPSGHILATYGISTSKVGIGTRLNSLRTPNGLMKVSEIIGQDAKVGETFEEREQTGRVAEILHTYDDLKKDEITTRILRLSGAQEHNENTYDRYIYIHGTPEEPRTGSIFGVNAENEPLGNSHGCIRTLNMDIVEIAGKTDPEKTYVYVDPQKKLPPGFVLSDEQPFLVQN